VSNPGVVELKLDRRKSANLLELCDERGGDQSLSA